MKTPQLIILAASMLIPAFAYAQEPATPAEAQQQKMENDSTKTDIKANIKEIASDEGKIKDSRADEKTALKTSHGEEKADLANVKNDKTTTKAQKKTKTAVIKKDKKAERKAVRDASQAERAPLERNVHLNTAAVKDEQKTLDAKEASEKP